MNKTYISYYLYPLPKGLLKNLFNSKEHQGIRKVRKGKSLMLSSLRTLRYDFATFAVNGFGLFQQPQLKVRLSPLGEMRKGIKLNKLYVIDY